MHNSEQHAQTTNTTPVDESILPMPTKGDTTPPAAKQKAPNSADAVPEFSRWLSIAKAVLDVNVMPMLNSSTSISASYTQKLHSDISAQHCNTAATTIPQQPASVQLSERRNLTDKAAATPIARALTPKHKLNANAENHNAAAR